MSRLRTEIKAQKTQKLRNLQNSENSKKQSFAGEFLIRRLSKCPGVGVEDTDKEQPQAESKNIQTKNEKSKTKEARDPAGSSVQRPEGLEVCKPPHVRR
jgi:hypothetical protein